MACYELLSLCLIYFPGYDSDGDDHSMGISLSVEEFLEPSLQAAYETISNTMLNMSNNTEAGGEAGEGSSGGTGASSSSGPSRRPNRNGGVLNTLLMGAGNRRSRLRGPERHAVLAPMLQDLIVSFTTGSDPLAIPLFSEELAGHPGDYVWGRGGFDAVITHLMSQLENTGPPPLTEVQIQNIPTVAIMEDQITNKLQCSICMEDFVLLENVKKLHCDHRFHETCIKPWLKMHATCPVCRKKLTEDSSAAASGTSAPAQEAPPPLPPRSR